MLAGSIAPPCQLVRGPGAATAGLLVGGSGAHAAHLVWRGFAVCVAGAQRTLAAPPAPTLGRLVLWRLPVWFPRATGAGGAGPACADLFRLRCRQHGTDPRPGCLVLALDRETRDSVEAPCVIMLNNRGLVQFGVICGRKSSIQVMPFV